MHKKLIIPLYKLSKIPKMEKKEKKLKKSLFKKNIYSIIRYALRNRLLVRNEIAKLISWSKAIGEERF